MRRHRYALRTLSALTVLLFSGIAEGQEPESSAAPHLATGVRVGEVTASAAIVWLRLTSTPTGNFSGLTRLESEELIRSGLEEPIKRRDGRLQELPEGRDVAGLIGAAPPSSGSARIVFARSAEFAESRSTEWRATSVAADGVLQFSLDGLPAASTVHYRVETRSTTGQPGAKLVGSFRTAAKADDASSSTRFTVVTGQMHRDLDDERGFGIYPSMAGLDPDFVVLTGDTVYYDNEWPRARGQDLARYHWQRMYSLPRHVEFHRRVPGFWMKDDHDVLDDDCWPGKVAKRVTPLTFADGQRIFLEQVPMGSRTYRRNRRGRHLEVWFLEGRDFRSPNTQEPGPEKTIWGSEQIDWLKRSLLESDATFKVLVSSTPIVGPDRSGKKDNHANATFEHEGRGFRNWARDHLSDRFWVVCGDRHWQYHSVDPTTGVQEFSCGPASDEHAGGTPGLDAAYHRFHRVGGGFLSVSVSTTEEVPEISFRLHAVDGSVVYDWTEHAVVADSQVPAAEVGSSIEEPIYQRLLALCRQQLVTRAAEVAALQDRDAIEARRKSIRESILRGIGQEGGFPEPTPLDARITGRSEHADWILEKVLFASRPGFHVTANLWLPRVGKAPFPVIAFPCGHSVNGKAGTTYQTAAQEFARRGFATFVYDPVGQGERFQFLDAEGKPRVGGTTEHTLTGTAALLVGSHLAAVEIHDGLRALDYLATRDDIDIDRLGLTGNSGGGTQTAYLMAVEDSYRAAAPSCYLTSFDRLLSTIGPQDAEQNIGAIIASGLDHADFVHAFAPRPALLACATDDFFDISGTWSTFRELKRVYARLGHPEAVDIVEVDGKHGYHPAIRQRVGRFFETTLLDRAPSEVRAEVALGEVHPDEFLQVTPRGQVALLPGERSIADLWRERESELAPRREERFASTPRAEWLGLVRERCRMLESVAAASMRERAPARRVGGAISRSVELLGPLDMPLPATWLTPAVEAEGDVGPSQEVCIVVSDRGRDDQISRLTARAARGERLLIVDLPGYGETAPRLRRNQWGTDWQLAFLSTMLDRPLAGLRADALRAVIAWARSQGLRSHIEACGRATVPALIAAALEPDLLRLRLEDGLRSWSDIVADGLHDGRLGNAVPGALELFDLPLLVRSLEPRQVTIVRARDPHGELLEAWPFR